MKGLSQNTHFERRTAQHTTQELNLGRNRNFFQCDQGKFIIRERAATDRVRAGGEILYENGPAGEQMKLFII